MDWPSPNPAPTVLVRNADPVLAAARARTLALYRVLTSERNQHGFRGRSRLADLERSWAKIYRWGARMENMTPEFEMLMHDPDLEATRGPGGTLIFLDGDQYCVVGPDFVSTEESDCYAFGPTREQAIANYALKHGAGSPSDSRGMCSGPGCRLVAFPIVDIKKDLSLHVQAL